MHGSDRGTLDKSTEEGSFLIIMSDWGLYNLMSCTMLEAKLKYILGETLAVTDAPSLQPTQHNHSGLALSLTTTGHCYH